MSLNVVLTSAYSDSSPPKKGGRLMLICEYFNIFIVVNFEKKNKLGLSDQNSGISIVLY